MLKDCRNCGSAFDAIGRATYCEPCRPLHKAEMKRAAAKRYAPGDAIKSRERQARHRERHREAIREKARALYATPERQAYMARKHSEERFAGLREAVLDRDNYRCQRCGAEWLPGARRIVIHHVDGDKAHNTMENLITLCRKCHPRIHGPLSEEHRQKIGTANRGKARRSPGPLSTEHRANIAAANRGKKQPESAKAALRESVRQQWAEMTPEQRAERNRNISEGRKGPQSVKSCGKAHASCKICAPEQYAKAMAGRKRWWDGTSPERRAELAEKTRETAQNRPPVSAETRAKQSDSLRKSWQERKSSI